jgi:hypothetical protein
MVFQFYLLEPITITSHSFCDRDLHLFPAIARHLFPATAQQSLPTLL